jgi:hypothetical protein
VRILGFAVSLLSVNYSPAFCDMADFLCVDSGNTFVLGQCCATVLPHVWLVKVKVKGTDEYRRTVDEFMCSNIYKAICSCKKVCVCVYHIKYVFDNFVEYVCVCQGSLFSMVHQGQEIFSSPRHPDQLWGLLSLLFNGYRWLFPRG